MDGASRLCGDLDPWLLLRGSARARDGGAAPLDPAVVGHPRSAFETVTSLAVIEELGRGIYPAHRHVLALVKDLPVLPFEPAVAEIVEVYVLQHVMPRDPVGDALHLAMASYHKCDFLLTWNCQHLANANKFGHIKRVNTKLGLHVPTLVTPLELSGDQDAN